MHKAILFPLAAIVLHAADPLPVVSMKTTPEELAHVFLVKPVPPDFECSSPLLVVCLEDGPASETDVTLRWIQLDGDPDMEAILTTKSFLLGGYAGYVFDRQDTKWNQVGSFMCRRECDGADFIRVRKLTEDSPALVLIYRDLGGSASTIMRTTAYQLYEGKLWPALEVDNFVWAGLPPPEREWHRTVSASQDRLVIHTVPSTSTRERETCEVQRWDAQGHQFVPAPADATKYCDPRTGKPLPGKAHTLGLPVVP